MEEMTQQNAALVEEAAASSESIVEQAKALNGTVAHYDVGARVNAASQPAPLKKQAGAATR
jgi:methyl-accepting chemotaxis protein